MPSVAIPRSRIQFLRRSITQWGSQNSFRFPWRTTQNKWHALTAELMLQRTRAEQVLPVYDEFVSGYESPTAFAKCPDPALFSRLGLHWRQRRFLELACALAATAIPCSKQELLSLPGVGEYIASAFLSLHMEVRQPLIDSNVVRLYGRFFGFDTDGETRRKKWFIEIADSVTPQKGFREFNYALIDFTRSVCRPAALHQHCPLANRCSLYSASLHRSDLSGH